MKKPNFFIVGFPKAGTTSMYNYLNTHPHVFMPKFKEPAFFDTDWMDLGLSKPATRIFDNIDQYLELFRNRKEKIQGEASTIYIYSKSAPRNIYEFNPESKILVMIRNPIKLIISNFIQFSIAGEEWRKDLNKILLEELETFEPYTMNIYKPAYIDRIFMYKRIKRYIKLFGKDNVKVIAIEKFSIDPKSHFKEILEFIGVSKKFSVNFKKYNSSRQPRFKIIRKITHTVPIGSVIYKLNKNIYFKLSEIIDRISTGHGKNKIEISLELREKIVSLAIRDIKKTQRLIGEDLVGLWFK